MELTSNQHQQIERLCFLAFGQEAPEIRAVSDANQGRGVFSAVYRVELTWPEIPVVHPAENRPAGNHPAEKPPSVIAKLPLDGANGEAARASGAYLREALAYEAILPQTPIRRPRLFALDRPGDNASMLLLEDLGQHHSVDQLVGLHASQAEAVAHELARLHDHWRQPGSELPSTVRRATIAHLDPRLLDNGLKTVRTVWAGDLHPEDLTAFESLLAARAGLVERFTTQGAETLCHGDPRADNLVFDQNQQPVLFDWQQIAVQFGEADIAWLAATSLKIDQRRNIDHQLVAAYGGDFDRYRCGMALPGLAVLMLAQRHIDGERTRRFVAASLSRIAAAVRDLDVASLA